MTIDTSTAAQIAHSYDVAAEYVPMSARHKPTPEQIAVRDQLAEIGNLDTYDATRIVMGRLADINARTAAGEAADAIACDITLRSLVGVPDEDMEMVIAHLKTQPDFNKAVRDFHYLDLEALKAQ